MLAGLNARVRKTQSDIIAASEIMERDERLRIERVQHHLADFVNDTLAFGDDGREQVSFDEPGFRRDIVGAAPMPANARGGAASSSAAQRDGSLRPSAAGGGDATDSDDNAAARGRSPGREVSGRSRDGSGTGAGGGRSRQTSREGSVRRKGNVKLSPAQLARETGISAGLETLRGAQASHVTSDRSRNIRL